MRPRDPLRHGKIGFQHQGHLPELIADSLVEPLVVWGISNTEAAHVASALASLPFLEETAQWILDNSHAQGRKNR